MQFEIIGLVEIWLKVIVSNNGTQMRVCDGGGTQYKSGYRDVPQTWVAKSGCQVHQWVPFFFSKMRYMDGCACFNRYIDGPFFIIGTSMGRKFSITGTAIVDISFSLS